MFFEFCSGEIYCQDRWPLVWEIEKAIQALILSDLPAVRSSSANTLWVMIADIVQDQGMFPAAQRNEPDVQWMINFIDEQRPYIRDFVESLAADALDLQDVSRIKDYGLLPTDNLSRCMKRSDSFRCHIQESAAI